MFQPTPFSFLILTHHLFCRSIFYLVKIYFYVHVFLEYFFLLSYLHIYIHLFFIIFVFSVSKSIKAYQCYLCAIVFVFKSNSKRHFRKIHPKDDYDITQIKNINFKCYKCPQEFDYYEIFEAHFEETHPNKTLKPESVQLGNTLTTAAKILSMRRKISSNYINSRPIIKPALTKFSQKNDDGSPQSCIIGLGG